ncbi:hypothetical protein J4476_03725 [Candidatus Woesearchaeota archaeon]|nr:hypothetical protein [Candidatus Woesearchaeota archaeon]HIH25342.1 hypothetical protein [Nanoarchaeota archaeon]
MRESYTEIFIESFRDIKENPSLLIPELIFIISTIIFTSLFLYINGLLKGSHLDYDTVFTFVTAIFNSTSSLLKLIISFVIITSVNIFLGLTTVTTKYVMCKKIANHKNVNIIECFLEAREHMFNVFWIKFLLAILYFLPLAIFTLFNFKNTIIVLILSLMVLFIWIILKLSFFYIYPTLIIEKEGVIESLKSAYKYFKQNKKHTTICALITFLTTITATYVLGLLANLLNSTIINPTLISFFTLLTTIVLAVISVWTLVFNFKSY